jgi:hypothetical protein
MDNRAGDLVLADRVPISDETTLQVGEMLGATPAPHPPPEIDGYSRYSVIERAPAPGRDVSW